VPLSFSYVEILNGLYAHATRENRFCGTVLAEVATALTDAGAQDIRGFAGAAGKYHETMTVAWARIIAHVSSSPTCSRCRDGRGPRPRSQ
jgi:hypothetical protein